MSHLNQFVQKCHANLINGDTQEINSAVDYLMGRHLKKESVITHQIGYCCFDDDIPIEIQKYGKEPDSKENYSYYMRGHLIVPIFSEFGRLVGFATRKPSSEDGNTWWNLPFKKGNHLFLLDKNRKSIFASNKIYLVEGYMDALLLWQEGIKEVVGIMGTSLTLRRIGLIARYCNNVGLCLDVDENQAGQRAKDKSVCILNKFNFCENISWLDLPTKIDPDEYIVKHGAQQLLSLEKVLDEKDIKELCRNVGKK